MRFFNTFLKLVRVSVQEQLKSSSRVHPPMWYNLENVMLSKLKHWLNEEESLTVKQRIGYTFLYPVCFVIIMFGLAIGHIALDFIGSAIATQIVQSSYPTSPSWAVGLENFFNADFWGGPVSTNMENILTIFVPLCILAYSIIVLWVWKSLKKSGIVALLFIPDVIIYLIVAVIGMR